MKYYKELLTIGIPAHNETGHLRRTIESCIDQAGFVIVSDNASTDDTQKICEELAQKYSNLIYIRQEKNIGGSSNFKACFDASKTKYFMWHGAHDYIDAQYSMHMLRALETSDAVGCWPASRWVDSENVEIGTSDCWFADRLSSDIPAERVYALIAHLHDCIGLFGIYRSDAIRSAPESYHYIIGGDHVFLYEMAKRGRILISRRSVYNWCQTKFEKTDLELRDGWQKSLGNNENVTKNSRHEMRERQLEILKSVRVHGGIAGFFKKMKFVKKAKKKLRIRFGD